MYVALESTPFRFLVTADTGLRNQLRLLDTLKTLSAPGYPECCIFPEYLSTVSLYILQ